MHWTTHSPDCVIELSPVLDWWARTVWRHNFPERLDLAPYPVESVTTDEERITVRLGPRSIVRDGREILKISTGNGCSPALFWRVHQTGSCNVFTRGFLLFLVNALQKKLRLKWNGRAVDHVSCLTVSVESPNPLRPLTIRYPGGHLVHSQDFGHLHQLTCLNLCDGGTVWIDLSPAQHFQHGDSSPVDWMPNFVSTPPLAKKV